MGFNPFDPSTYPNPFDPRSYNWVAPASGAIYTGVDFLAAGALPDYGPGSALPAGVSFDQSLVGGVAKVPGQVLGTVIPGVTRPVFQAVADAAKTAGQTVYNVTDPTSKGIAEAVERLLGGAGRGIGGGVSGIGKGLLVPILLATGVVVVVLVVASRTGTTQAAERVITRS